MPQVTPSNVKIDSTLAARVEGDVKTQVVRDIDRSREDAERWDGMS